MKKLFFGLLLYSACFLMPIYATADPFAAMDTRPLTDGIVAPAFSLKRLNGNETHLADYSGQVILLNFWATWCMPCRQEMPAIELLWQQYREKGLVVVGVSNDDIGKQKRVLTFIKKMNLSFPILLDDESTVSNLYDVSGIPVSYLIGRDGILIAKIVGTREWDSQEAFSLVENLLKKLN